MPEGAVPDPNPQALSQAASVETIARLSGLFLRGTVLEDQDALDEIFNAENGTDPAIASVVGEQAVSVPEPMSAVGIGVGLLSLIALKKRAA